MVSLRISSIIGTTYLSDNDSAAFTAGVHYARYCQRQCLRHGNELRQLRDENRQLKTLVADLTLDKHILQEVLSKKV